MPSNHTHPHPLLNRLTHRGAFLLLMVMLVAAVAQVALALRDSRATLLGVAAIFTLALTLPVMLLLWSTPPVSVDDDGLTIKPVVGPATRVRWSDVRAVKDYPLLPPRESESNRRLLIGRKRYQPAEGLLLVIPSLQPMYCVAGFFCGEGLTPVIGLTNRAHTDYAALAQRVRAHVEGA